MSENRILGKLKVCSLQLYLIHVSSKAATDPYGCKNL